MANQQTEIQVVIPKKWYLSKTLWFNIIGFIVAAAGELVQSFPTGEVAKIAGFVLTIGNIILRLITNVPIQLSSATKT